MHLVETAIGVRCRVVHENAHLITCSDARSSLRGVARLYVRRALTQEGVDQVCFSAVGDYL